jgi:hypothetical protein
MRANVPNISVIQESARLNITKFDAADINPVLSLTGKEYQHLIRKELIPIVAIPGTGHTYICYSVKNNVYVEIDDDSMQVFKKSKNISDLLNPYANDLKR